MKSIQVENLQKKYGRLEAVKSVSFEVDEGEIFGFLGPNGAGKTTTINVLCTLLNPSGGSASVNGYDVVKQRNEVRRSIGLVFQESTLDEYLTAEQNLLFHSYAYGVSKDIRDQRMKDLLDLVDLWDRRKGKTRTYSGGMKRRLEIVRGLIHHPRVLFLDEPTLGLDPQTRRYIWDYVEDIRVKENLTIFLTTHYMDEAEHCDRIAVIDDGNIVAIDTPDKLKAFQNKYNIPYTFLSDRKKTVARMYDAKGWFFPKRVTFIIDETGTIQKIIRDVNVNTHGDDILKILGKNP